MDITGKIHKVFPIQEFKNNFTKREFVIIDDTSDQFPQYITFQLLKDRCSLIDSFNEGDEIKVTFNLNGREWTNPEGKIVYFNSLVAWKLDKISEGSGKSQSQQKPDSAVPPPPSVDEYKSEDDMPF